MNLSQVTSPIRAVKGKRLQPSSTNQIHEPLETLVNVPTSILRRVTDDVIKYTDHPVNKCIRLLNQFTIEAFIKAQNNTETGPVEDKNRESVMEKGK